MPRLVHLNGPPGIGKSTLARRYVNDHPLAFCLDIDGIRRLLGRWDEHEQESGRLARSMALRMTAEHLSNGFDVVVPQYVARPALVDDLRSVATTAHAPFHEIVLLDSRGAAQERFTARAEDPAWTEHHADAMRMMAPVGGFAAMYDALTAFVEGLPDAVTIATTASDVEGAYRAMLRALDAG